MENIQALLSDCESKVKQFIEALKIMSTIKWDSETALDFFKKYDISLIQDMNKDDERLLRQCDYLNQFNYRELNEKLKFFLKQCENITANNYSKFNEPYKNYLNDYIKSTYNLLNSFFDTLNKIKLKRMLPNLILDTIYNALNYMQNNFNPNINDLFEHFKYGEKNYIIFGKNGAGKTTLLNQIAVSYFHGAVVVPADRKIVAFDENSAYLFYPTYKLNDMLADPHSLSYLVEELNNKTLNAYESGADCNKILRAKFYEIFSALGLERKIIVRDKNLFLYGDNIAEYHINKASDGERSVAYFIMAALLAPQYAYLFIDEPERHLNGSLMRNLFDKLELERPDLQFVYSTHIIDFVETRKNIELVYLEKTGAVNKWKFKKLEDYKDISLEIILSIEGTKNNIIFCEGNRDSIDCQILDCLFPQFDIKPVASCEQVKLNVKGINGLEYLFRRKAFGVVDNDYMGDEEILSLKHDNIFVIGYNEWENFIIRSEILEYINLKLLNKDLSAIKHKVMSFIKNEGKIPILSDFLTKRYAKKIYATKLKYNDKLENQIDVINESNKRTILNETNTLQQRIDDITDYDELVAIVPAKMLLNMVANELGFNSDKAYVTYMVDHLKIDADFNSKVKDLLNINFDA